MSMIYILTNICSCVLFRHVVSIIARQEKEPIDAKILQQLCTTGQVLFGTQVSTIKE